jgi:hypothetical protein
MQGWIFNNHWFIGSWNSKFKKQQVKHQIRLQFQIHIEPIKYGKPQFFP